MRYILVLRKTINGHILIMWADDHAGNYFQRKSIVPIGNIGLLQTFFFDLASFFLLILLHIGRITEAVLAACRLNLVC